MFRIKERNSFTPQAFRMAYTPLLRTRCGEDNEEMGRPMKKRDEKRSKGKRSRMGEPNTMHWEGMEAWRSDRVSVLLACGFIIRVIITNWIFEL